MKKINKDSFGRFYYHSEHNVLSSNDLLKIQMDSFYNLIKYDNVDGNHQDQLLYKLFKKVFPVSSNSDEYVLDFVDYKIGNPKYSYRECLEYRMTYSVPLNVVFRLYNKNTNEVLEDSIYLGNIPYITHKSSFIINGIERVVINQLLRTSGITYCLKKKSNKTQVYLCHIIPDKGVWLDIVNDSRKNIYVVFNNKYKFTVTSFLRVLGLDDKGDILKQFGLIQTIKVSKDELKKYLGKKLATDVIEYYEESCLDFNNKKIVFNRKNIIAKVDEEISKEMISLLIEKNIDSVNIFVDDLSKLQKYESLINTLQLDVGKSVDDIACEMYQKIYGIETINNKIIARKQITALVLDEAKYRKGEMIRMKLEMLFPDLAQTENEALTLDEFIHILDRFIDISNEQYPVDDIDFLGIKKLLTVGDHMYQNIYIGLSKIARIACERLNCIETDSVKIQNFINVKIFISTINSFFNLSQLSQFLDEINPLSQIVHKRKVSLSSSNTEDNTVSQIRDVHYSHYGRLCIVETPEGTTIGLILSLAIHSLISKIGALITPYRKVVNGKVDLDNSHIIYLSANDDFDKYIIQATTPVDSEGYIIDSKVTARKMNDVVIVNREEVNYMDISTTQPFSVSVSLIPFLEHNDAGRSLMGANMQRQAVPLLRPQTPIVGTGLESKVARDFRGLLIAENDGIVTYVDAKKIIIEYDIDEEQQILSYETNVKEYNIEVMQNTNQNTCATYRSIVRKNQRVKKGDILTEGFATDKGELALGVNLKVAFISWKGYNYEDAIVISEKVIKEDLLTSIHVYQYDADTKNTKLGQERFTRDIYNFDDKTLSSLDQNGLICEGIQVRPGDVLVGKVTPHGKLDSTAEEKLLRAIFGNKAYDEQDVSLRVPAVTYGTVIKSKILKRNVTNKSIIKKIKQNILDLKTEFTQKLIKFRELAIQKFVKLLNGIECNGVITIWGELVVEPGEIFNEKIISNVILKESNIGQNQMSKLSPIISDLEDLLRDNWTHDAELNHKIVILIHNTINKHIEIINEYEKQYLILEYGYVMQDEVLDMATVYIANKRKLQIGDKMSGRHGNKGIVSKILKEEDMPFLADGTPVDIVLTPLGVPARMNLGQLYETLLGWAGLELGKKYRTPILNGFTLEQVNEELREAGLPEFGEVELYDGLTGEKFDQKATVGVIYMLKLNHLVDDKVHARSIGAYSMITQQPLGGRSNFGGQRLGEMEIWALEAFGAAHILQEMLTVKSDDVSGRNKTYEAIIKGEKFPIPNIPETFYVLIQELRGLCLDISFV